MLDKIATFASKVGNPKIIVLAFSLLVIDNGLFAQNNISFHTNGKIYLVIGVLAAIFIGIIGFLVYLERKLNKLEKQINNNE